MPAAEALQQTLELLRGPTNERRFVGLLMAVKTLRPGDEAAARQVYEAAGEKFFQRLLLPLHSAQGGNWDQEALPKAAGMCAVGLAVLSSLYCCSDIAQQAAEVEKAPLFLKVVRHGGVLAASGAEIIPQDFQGAEQVSVGDALQCLLGLACAGAEPRAVVLQSGALPTLARALASPSASRSWALRLLITLLNQPGRGELLTGRAPQLAALVAVLGHALGEEAATLQRSGGPAATGGPDAAATQLEVLHALQLLLPPPEAAEAELEAAAQGGKAAWLDDARQGLQLLLRARLAPEQRLGALRLTSAFAQLASPGWLLGAPDCTFFRLLAGLVKVEIILLLRDALSPDARVPAESSDGAAGTAGDRAAASLPSLLELFEGLLQALGEPEAERLPKGAAEQAMGSLTEAADALLQFLETAAEQQRDDVTCLAAVRALGRFAADMGGHFEPPRMRKLLPWLAGVQGHAGLAFLLPLLMQAGGESAGAKGLLAAVRSPEVALPLAELVRQETREQGSQAKLHMATIILATLADDLGDGSHGAPHLLQAVGSAARSLAAWVTAAKGSLEPRLLAAIGHLIAGAMAAAPGSWAEGSEAQQGSRALLLALEVGDRLLTLQAAGAAQRRADRLDLSALGVSLGAPPGGTDAAEEQEELAEEVGEQSTAALRLAAEALPRLPALRAAAAASEWRKEAAARGPSKPRTAYSTALEAFCRAVAQCA